MQYNQLPVLEGSYLPTSVALFTLFGISPIADSPPGAVLGVWAGGQGQPCPPEPLGPERACHRLGDLWAPWARAGEQLVARQGQHYGSWGLESEGSSI